MLFNSASDKKTIILYMLIGVCVCFMFVWMIKQISDLIKHRNFRLLYLRYVIPMLITSILPYVILRNFISDEITLSEKAQKLILYLPPAITFSVCLIICLVKYGAKRGISLFIMQSFFSLMLFCAAYTAVALGLIAIALVAGICMLYEGRYKEIISCSTFETELVTPSGSGMWMDTNGETYSSFYQGHLIRNSDNEIFMFV